MQSRLLSAVGMAVRILGFIDLTKREVACDQNHTHSVTWNLAETAYQHGFMYGK